MRIGAELLKTAVAACITSTCLSLSQLALSFPSGVPPLPLSPEGVVSLP